MAAYYKDERGRELAAKLHLDELNKKMAYETYANQQTKPDPIILDLMDGAKSRPVEGDLLLY
jgi:hypothetical protein